MEKLKSFRNKSAMMIPKCTKAVPLFIEWMRDNQKVRVLQFCTDHTDKNENEYFTLKLFPKEAEKLCIKYINDNI